MVELVLLNFISSMYAVYLDNVWDAVMMNTKGGNTTHLLCYDKNIRYNET